MIDAELIHAAKPIHAMAFHTSYDLGAIVLVVVDLPDDMRAALPADDYISNAHHGSWFGGGLDGEPVLVLGLSRVAPAGEEAGAVWYFPSAPLNVVEPVTNPHTVIVLPSDTPSAAALIAGDSGRVFEELDYAVIVQTDLVPRSLRSLRVALAAGEDPGPEDLVPLSDPQAVHRAFGPMHSRRALATGEMLTDNQLIPMAWRPWHYDLVAEPKGLHYSWPIVQTYFGFKDPSSIPLAGVAAPSPEQRRKLRSYLDTVQRLARSISVNSGGSIKTGWSRHEGQRPIEVDAPHEDALDALLSHLRKLVHHDENSRIAFTRMQKALSAAAKEAGDDNLMAELRVWRKAHATLLRSHLAVLMYELAGEYTGEEYEEEVARGPLPGAPDISPDELLRLYMYGQTMHLDDDKVD
ncbi:MAG: hypothetical protein Q7T73_06980 [Beijerinckiaceae bacterium]|nr:hypothetical protein [Beijerinckiaceae bacterium]